MINKAHITLLLLTTLTLSGCINREQADAKLAKACIAAATAMLEEDTEIMDIKDQTFSDTGILNGDYRYVSFTATEDDGWLKTEKSYRCAFHEEVGPFRSNYNAAIYRLKAGDAVYGMDENDNIIGNISDYQRLMGVVQNAIQ
ncbi:MAG: hypothetical protein KTR28_02670 [Micavibrio sp.]|nr:hypothetical protein [Micavibrio sp.]